MKALRHLGSAAFVVGLFVAVFGGIPWHVMVASDPAVPLWLRAAVFCLLGGMLIVLATLAFERKGGKLGAAPPSSPQTGDLVLVNSETVPGREIGEALGLVQGHTVFAIWIGKDLSAVARLILGGELTEYTEMMGSARAAAVERMMQEALGLGADAVINVRYMTTSVVGSAAELLVYGTAVRLAS